MIQRALLEGMNAAIIGPTVLEQWVECAPTIRRHVFDTPRRRKRHSALAAYCESVQQVAQQLISAYGSRPPRARYAA